MRTEVVISRHHIQAEELASSGQGLIPDQEITPKQFLQTVLNSIGKAVREDPPKSGNLEMTFKKSHGAAPSGVTRLNTFDRVPGISITSKLA